MVTKKQLQQAARKQAQEEAAKKRRSEESDAKWRAEYDAKNADRARTLLDGELGQALVRWNKAGMRQIKLDQCRVWKVEDGNEVYGDPFDLGFVPAPDYQPTKILLAALKKAGYEARISAEEEGNVEFQHFSDGMGPVSVPGTHTVHYLIIDWS